MLAGSPGRPESRGRVLRAGDEWLHPGGLDPPLTGRLQGCNRGNGSGSGTAVGALAFHWRERRLCSINGRNP